MIAEELARWGTGPVDAPDEVSHAAKRHLLDGVGTALGAQRTHAATAAVRVALGLAGPPQAVVLGTREQIGAPAAGLANGTLVHALDFDDTHARGLVHATAVVLPAAFAVGQEVGATGREVLEAAIVGYETVCRVSAAAPYGFHQRGLHATMVAGVFSSALVASRLMGLDWEGAANALGIAGSQAGGLLAFLATGASTKQLHPGFAAQAGIIAARLAAEGATGPATVFDGPHGVYEAFAAGEVDRAGIVAGLGSRWETVEIGIKPYPACQLSHATLAAVSDAMRRGGFGPGEVEAVHARVHPDSAAVVCETSRDLTSPASPYAAKFSLPWSLAALVVDGHLALETYSPGAVAREDIRDLARRVTWDLLDSPKTVASDTPGEVSVRLRDGRVVSGHVDRSPGGGSNPLARDELIAKFEGNLGCRAPDLIHLIERFEDQPGLDRLGELAAEAIADRPKSEAATPCHSKRSSPPTSTGSPTTGSRSASA